MQVPILYLRPQNVHRLVVPTPRHPQQAKFANFLAQPNNGWMYIQNHKRRVQALTELPEPRGPEAGLQALQ